MSSELPAKLLSRVLRLARFKSGLTRLSFNPIVNRLMRNAPPRLQARLSDGNFIEINPHDYDGRILYLFGTNDPKVERTAVALLRPGDTFLDIGANHSSIGLAASQIVGPKGQVHLFEPQSEIADRVQAAIDAGGYENVRLHRLGLSDRDAVLTLRSPASHSGMATFERDHGDEAFSASEECRVREIASYAAPLVSGPFGVKLDIEGGEPKVLPWLIRHPNLIFIIFEACRHQAELFQMVGSSQLALFGLYRSPFRHKLRRVHKLKEMKKFHDVLAVRDLTRLKDNPKLFT